MELAPEEIQRISEKVGEDVTTLAGVRKLMKMMDEVNSKTKIIVSRNTLRRLFGLDPTPVKPRITTLDAIAVAIGYPDWGRFLNKKPTLKEGFYNDMVLTYDMTALNKGALVGISWNPDRSILLEHLGAGKYKVVASENGKLRKDDILNLDRLTIGLPFVANQVRRKKELIGSYNAAAGSAIHDIEVIKNESY